MVKKSEEIDYKAPRECDEEKPFTKEEEEFFGELRRIEKIAILKGFLLATAIYGAGLWIYLMTI